ncbi:MAG: hypothetical protein ACLVK4_01865 [Alistipes shahii]|uniref:hypothetical protein n=1 Tax=Alistipes shahii TaxID=328814 RepID=UPI00399CD739
MTLARAAEIDCSMRYYNADGSEGEMCGNGARRCAVRRAPRHRQRNQILRRRGRTPYRPNPPLERPRRRNRAGNDRRPGDPHGRRLVVSQHGSAPLRRVRR